MIILSTVLVSIPVASNITMLLQCIVVLLSAVRAVTCTVNTLSHCNAEFKKKNTILNIILSDWCTCRPTWCINGTHYPCMLFRIYYLDNLSKFGRSSDANSFTVLSQALSLAQEFKRKCGLTLTKPS